MMGDEEDDLRGGQRLVAMMAVCAATFAVAVVVVFWPAISAGAMSVITMDGLSSGERAALQTHGVGPQLVGQGYAPLKVHDGNVLWGDCSPTPPFPECAKAVAEGGGRFILTSYDRNWRGTIVDTQYAAAGFPVYLDLGGTGSVAIQTCPAPEGASFEDMFRVERPNAWGECAKA